MKPLLLTLTLGLFLSACSSNVSPKVAANNAIEVFLAATNILVSFLSGRSRNYSSEAAIKNAAAKAASAAQGPSNPATFLKVNAEAWEAAAEAWEAVKSIKAAHKAKRAAAAFAKAHTLLIKAHKSEVENAADFHDFAPIVGTTNAEAWEASADAWEAAEARQAAAEARQAAEAWSSQTHAATRLDMALAFEAHDAAWEASADAWQAL